MTAWLATPEELRPVSTLRQLALSIGVRPDGAFYALASSPEVSKKVLGITAAIALPHVPSILERLAQLALKGNVRAAEVYLTFIHQVVRSFPQDDSRPDWDHLVDKAAKSAGVLLEKVESRGETAHERPKR